MLDAEGAGAVKDDGQPGSGAPGGGSPEGGSENDDKPITAKQLKAALESQKRHYEGQLANQRAEFEAFKEGVGKQQPKPAVEQPQRYTRAQLKAAVDAGQITREQADEHWERQLEAELTAKAEAAALAAVKGSTTQERLASDLSEYKRLKPEIMERGSEVRESITQAYRRMVGRGSPDTEATELAAIEAVLGPLEKLKNAATARRAPESDEQGGGGGDGKTQKTGKTMVDKLDSRYREHYEKLIKQGLYTDWSAVEKELKDSPPSTRARMGLPA